jgi:hypothetical protein
MKDFALWVNDAILLATGVLIWRYVRATSRLVKTSQDQVEGLSRPALVIQEAGGNRLTLVNIGNGPALGIEWRFKDRDSSAVFFESGEPVEALSYLEQRQTKAMSFEERTLVNREMHCLYRSISGQRYLSVSKFTAKGIFETEFYAETGELLSRKEPEKIQK